jgi:acyl carrier protein
MTDEQIRDVILRALRQIAPEADPRQIDPSADLREQIDLDSMDFLNLVLGVNRELGVEIPESDYGRLNTLDGWIAYLAAQRPTATDTKPLH